MVSLATSDDFVTYGGATTAPPDDIDLQLRDASRIVRRAVRNAVYAVDADGNATLATIIAALRDATCAQVQAWIRLGIDRTSGGVVTVGTVTAKSIGSASLSYSDSGAAAAARAAANDDLVPVAVDILLEAGLLRNTTWGY